MRTTDRIQTVFPEPDKDLDPADIFHDGLGSIFSDTVQDQHGDPSAVILYKSEKYGILKLKVVDPNEGGEWKLFAHYVWNAGVRMAVLVGQEEHIIEESKRWQWNVEGQMVLELGSGAGLPGIVSVLAGAEEVKLSDYPSFSTLQNLQQNIDVNIPRHLRMRAAVAGHLWGDFFTSPRSNFPVGKATTLSANNPHRFTRILAADTYWIPEQHANLARSMLHFLAWGAEARVLMTAGFHTGRAVLAKWFEVAREEGLEAEKVWEEDGDGRVRDWLVDRAEAFEEEKRWMVLAVLKRRAEQGTMKTGEMEEMGTSIE